MAGVDRGDTRDLGSRWERTMRTSMRGQACCALAVLGLGMSGAGRAADEGALLIQALPAGHPYVLYDATVPAPAGEYWALACAGRRCRLEPAHAHWAPDTVATHEEPEAPAQRLYTVAPADAIVLVRGVPGLAAGSVRTDYVNPMFPATRPTDETTSAFPDLTWRAGARALRLRIEWLDHGEWCTEAPCAAQWVLEGDGAPVVLARADIDAIYGQPGVLAPVDFLVWSGDLDGDGLTDHLVRPQPRPDYMELRLLLGRDRPVDGSEWPIGGSFYWWDPTNPGC
jgi:hypothetical protein